MYKNNGTLSRNYQANKTSDKKQESKIYKEENINKILSRRVLIETTEGYFLTKVKV